MTIDTGDYPTADFILNLKKKVLFLKLLPSLGEKDEKLFNFPYY